MQVTAININDVNAISARPVTEHFVAWNAPRDFSALIEAEIPKWAPVIKANNVQP